MTNRTMTEKPQTETLTTKNEGTERQNPSQEPRLAVLADEKPADHPALALLKSQPVTDPHSAALLLADLTATVIDALPGGSSRRLADLVHATDPSRYAGSVKDREAADRRKDAARYREQAARAESEAAALDAVEPGEYAATLLAKEAKWAKESAERAADRAGAITVSHYSPFGDNIDVDVKPSELRRAGYHHHTKCGGGTPARIPDHELVRDVWQALLDHHDRAHGLTSWTNCPDQACTAIPEEFRASPWTLQNPEWEDYDA
jgi:hypothetical protein